DREGVDAVLSGHESRCCTRAQRERHQRASAAGCGSPEDAYPIGCDGVGTVLAGGERDQTVSGGTATAARDTAVAAVGVVGLRVDACACTGGRGAARTRAGALAARGRGLCAGDAWPPGPVQSAVLEVVAGALRCTGLAGDTCTAQAASRA